MGMQLIDDNDDDDDEEKEKGKKDGVRMSKLSHS